MANAGYRQTDWRSYFDNLAEAIEVAVAHTEPGAIRDRIFRRWLQVEMVQRLSGRRFLRYSSEEAAELFDAAHRIASRYFGEGALRLLQPLSQRVARGVIAGDLEEVRRTAELAAPWATYPRVLQVGWVDGHVQISGTVQLSDVMPSGSRPATRGPNSQAEPDIVEEAEAIFAAMPEEPMTERRFTSLVGELAPEVLWLGMERSTLRLDLTERRTGETWAVPVAVHRLGLAASFSAEIDPNTLAAGTRLADGLWDLYLHFGVMGLGMRRRVTLTEERQPGRVLPEPVADGPPTMAAYFTKRTSGLCLDVGLVKHRKLAIKPRPIAVPVKKPSFARRLVRKVRRMSRRPRQPKDL